jgi:carbamoyltransferase
MVILGIHGGVTLGQHEPSAALIVDGRIVASCEEERYLRIKSAYGLLPSYSIKACLDIGGIAPDDIDLVVCSGVTYDDFKARIADFLRHSFDIRAKLELVHHQEAHIAAAFYGSGYDRALCLSLDATGDGHSGFVVAADRSSGFQVLERIPTKNSLGYFYTMMTHYLGYSDGDEYKVMGLAPYGQPTVDLESVIRPGDGVWDFDWSFIRSEPSCKSPFEPLYSSALSGFIGQPNRSPNAPLTAFHKNLARSTQDITERCILNLVSYYKEKYPDLHNLCYAGGIALNCVVNGRLAESGLFKNIYVPPVASDRGLALGCAYLGAVMSGDDPQALSHPYWGTDTDNDAVRAELIANGVRFVEIDDPAATAAELIAMDKIIGWVQGRSEAGARALGNRSIIANPRSEEMKNLVNKKIKYREEFRPFAPSILRDRCASYFNTYDMDSPHMCFTFSAIPERVAEMGAVVHVDGTSRIQTVDRSDNVLYYELISAFEKMTGSPVILNTSFNLKGQPIVDSPRDSLMTFYGCGLDALVIGNFLLEKEKK